MKKDYLRLLKKEYYELINWKPDYEKVGIQFGPSEKEINKVLNKIRKLEPEFEKKFVSKYRNN